MSHSSPSAGPSSGTTFNRIPQPSIPDIRGMQVLDKSRFDLVVPILGVVVDAKDVKRMKMDPMIRHITLDVGKVPAVEDGPLGKKIIRLRVSKVEDLPQEAKEVFDEIGHGYRDTSFKIGYDHWNVSEVLTAILPTTMEDIPSSYAQTGHIAHVNLRDEALPYKHIIGEVILSKNKQIRTVVNKLANIHAEFRYFDMEVIAGEDNEDVFVSTVEAVNAFFRSKLTSKSENNCTLTLNFKKVYWNSRLHTEHERLVDQFQAGDVVADVMAGVGPFAVPAAKKGCRVLGNDLNPEGTKWMEVNRINNKLGESLRITTLDGRQFIREAALGLWDKPFPPVEVAKSRKQKDREAKEARKQREAQGLKDQANGLIEGVVAAVENLSVGTTTAQSPSVKAEPQQIDHFVMNLPDSALTFLDAYRGAYAALEDRLGSREDIKLGIVHVYCFTREMEREQAEIDILQRASHYLGYPLTPQIESYNLHLVRSVAPNKEMYCLSFKIPAEVAFARD